MTDVRQGTALQKGRASDRYLVQPKRYWYPVLLDAELRRTPVRVEVFGIPFVLYRNAAAEPIAHLDRCPHRNVPLSQGRCLPDGTLECPYHGWRFASDGSCVLIPGLVTKPRETHRVETYRVTCKYGILWLCPHPEGPLTPITPLQEFEARGYSRFVRKVTFPAGLFAVLENALDVPHTSVLHRGLFRSERRRRVSVTMRRYRDFAEAQYEGEPPPSGILARALALGRHKTLTVQHWDRFFTPNTLQVEYRLVHVVVTGYCTPVGPEQTLLFAVVTIRTPMFSMLERGLLRLLEPLAMRVYRQDVAILAMQRNTLEAFGGERFMSTPLDVLGAAITRLLKEAHEREILAAEEARVPSDTSPTPPDHGTVSTDREEPREVTNTEFEA